jgi:hypothetical protein
MDSSVVGGVHAYMPGGAGAQSGESAMERAHVVMLVVEVKGSPMLPTSTAACVCIYVCIHT